MTSTRASAPEEIWIRNLNQLLEKRYDDPELNVKDLARAVNLSERQFYRKMKRLTGVTPVHYIRRLRLHRARLLLEKGEVETVRQLAAEVGYLRADYFSRLYCRRFGYMPNDRLRDE